MAVRNVCVIQRDATKMRAAGDIGRQLTKHGIRADFIIYYMENAINLLIIPPYCFHLLQPLDIEVFSAFESAHNGEIDALPRLNI